MISLPSKLTCCPCGCARREINEDQLNKAIMYNGSYRYYHCANNCSIKITFLEHYRDPESFFVIRIVDDLVFWWCSRQAFQVKYNGKYKELDFILPYNVSEERLKTLMVFI